MSIKQNGGVFGRNPTFNDVTIEGQLTFDGDIDINSDLKINGGLQVLGTTEFENNINVNVGNITVDDGAVYITHSSDKALQFARTSANTFSFEHSTSEMYLYNGTTSAASINFKNGGDVHVNSGNLVIGTSGKGIDFSATAGTGTSELLDDYEEGVWTPADGSGAGLSFSSTAGVYTKIGRTVFATGFVNYPVTSNSAATKISGLPFAALNSNARGVGSINYKQTASADTIMIDNNASTLAFFTATGSVTTNAQLSNTAIYFGLVYTVS
tara:strand:- start:1825 stop:2631 length:807 start_codon:yes stop_codon:yes gene_type:complete